jgi:hypothetical protein
MLVGRLLIHALTQLMSCPSIRPGLQSVLDGIQHSFEGMYSSEQVGSIIAFFDGEKDTERSVGTRAQSSVHSPNEGKKHHIHVYLSRESSVIRRVAFGKE